MTVKDQNGKVVFTNQREFSENFFVAPGKEKAMLADWDIFALELVDLSLPVGETNAGPFIIPFAKGTKWADIEAKFTYEYRPGVSKVIQKVVKRVNFPEAVE